MLNGLIHAHSGIRWIILILMIVAVLKALAGWFGKKEYANSDKKLSLYTFIFVDIQLLIGIILYFISSKVAFSAETMGNDVLRFFTMEHETLTILAVILVHLGYIKTKKADNALAKHKKTALYYGIALVLILAAIPWPFRGLGTGWF